jgi:hypothetical protein
LRGTSGEFSAGAITGVSFTGSGSGLTSIPNSATTANSANGASTIVARDANGSFTANVITGTTGTFTNISGNGVSLTAINASNITSGTIANARTTASDANGASTIVSRSAAGSFAGNVGTFNGVTVGTTNSSFDTNVLFVDATNNRVGMGTATPSYTAQIVNTSAGAIATQLFLQNNNATDGTGARLDFSGFNDGTTATGSVANVRDGAGIYSLRFNTFGGATNAERMRIFSSGGVSIGNTTDPGATNLSVTGTIAGNGAPLTAINASNIASGTVANARTTAATANGASTIVLRGTSGEFSAGAITSVSISGNGIALTAINASNIASGTLANARTTANASNGASTIVTRDASGNFTSNEITSNVQIVENGIYVNKKTIATNYTIAADYNGLSAGPVTVANSVTVTVSTGSTWVVV